MDKKGICERIETEILELLNDSELNIEEIIYVVGRLVVDAGASIEGIKETITAEIYEQYKGRQTIGNALICMGCDILGWIKVLEEEKKKDEEKDGKAD